MLGWLEGWVDGLDIGVVELELRPAVISVVEGGSRVSTCVKGVIAGADEP